MTGRQETVELEKFLSVYQPEIRELALQARFRLFEIAGPASEFVFDATTVVCVGLCHTYNWRDGFVNIAVYPKHVTIVFSWGAKLHDPERRLCGEGRQVRHIRLEGIQTLSDPYVVGLIEQARECAVMPKPALEPQKFIKVYNGPKRR